MNREQEILSTAARKAARGIDAAQQYEDLNRARDKRKRKRERNFRHMLSGGTKQVVLLP